MINKYLFAAFMYVLSTSPLINSVILTSVCNEIQTANKEDSKNIKYDPKSVDDLMSKNIINFLKYSYLKKELDQLTELDRRFQMYMIDLNGDGKDEYFVRFMSPYFCGTGGCTFLLLDRYAEVITSFSVSDPPFYISTQKTKKWKNLYVRSGSAIRLLKFNGKKYPSNPSICPAVKLEKGSISKTIFDDQNNPALTYTY